MNEKNHPVFLVILSHIIERLLFVAAYPVSPLGIAYGGVLKILVTALKIVFNSVKLRLRKLSTAVDFIWRILQDDRPLS